MVRQFQFQKSVEEIEIEGVRYQFKTDDESLFALKDKLMAYGQEMQALSQEDLLPEDLFAKNKTLLKGVLDATFGEGAFDKLYAAAGQSLFNLIDLVDYMGDIVREKVNKKQQRQQSKKDSHYASKRHRSKR